MPKTRAASLLFRCYFARQLSHRDFRAEARCPLRTSRQPAAPHSPGEMLRPPTCIEPSALFFASLVQGGQLHFYWPERPRASRLGAAVLYHLARLGASKMRARLAARPPPSLSLRRVPLYGLRFAPPGTLGLGGWGVGKAWLLATPTFALWMSLKPKKHCLRLDRLALRVLFDTLNIAQCQFSILLRVLRH